MLEATEQTAGTVESCVELLKKSQLIGIYPGGTREAYLGNNNYQVVWPERAGFAKLAIQAKVVIRERQFVIFRM